VAVVRLPGDPVARDEAIAEAPVAAPSAGFRPNVIRGDFGGRLAGVRHAAPETGSVQLPLYGRIAAGMPIEALSDNSNHVDVPVSMLGAGEHFALEVDGESMRDAGIWDGDTVLIRRTDTADNGEIVVALVDNAEVTLKRLRRRGHSIALEPANEAFKTQIYPADKVRVQGKLVGLLRRY
jgi:repressor LexA